MLLVLVYGCVRVYESSDAKTILIQPKNTNFTCSTPLIPKLTTRQSTETAIYPTIFTISPNIHLTVFKWLFSKRCPVHSPLHTFQCILCLPVTVTSTSNLGPEVVGSDKEIKSQTKMSDDVKTVFRPHIKFHEQDFTKEVLKYVANGVL
jgi:hypothetical protein